MSLRRKKLLNNYSVHDVLWNLTKIYLMEAWGQRLIGEVSKSARNLMEKLEIPITEILGS